MSDESKISKSRVGGDGRRQHATEIKEISLEELKSNDRRAAIVDIPTAIEERQPDLALDAECLIHREYIFLENLKSNTVGQCLKPKQLAKLS